MNKQRPMSALVEAVSGASTVSFGGGGMIRKPMTAVAAIGLSDAKPFAIDIVLGGPDVDVLLGMGKVNHLLAAYVGMDGFGLAPNFRVAREQLGLEMVETSEYMCIAALEAAATGVPFMPTYSGLGTDVMTRTNTPYRLVTCPFTDRTLVAVPRAEIDVAVLHVNLADRRGNCVITGESFCDLLLARAAKSVWVTAEKVVDELPSLDERPPGGFISRMWVSGVVEAPGGAGFTGIYPDYPLDAVAAGQYMSKATDREWLTGYLGQLLETLEAVA